jgi:hypothetical protein
MEDMMMEGGMMMGGDPTLMGDDMMMLEGEGKGPVAYYKLLVEYEISGGFANYLKFRNVLALKDKIVNIEEENIKKDQKNPGNILAKAKVSLVKVASQ